MKNIEELLKKYSLELKTMIVFRKAGKVISNKEEEVFNKYNITPTQFGVLDLLRAKEKLIVQDLIEKLFTTSGNITCVLANMEKNDLIKKEVNPDDKRSFLISLTSKGRNLIDELLVEHVENVNNIFSVLTTEDKENLIQIFKKFKNLK